MARATCIKRTPWSIFKISVDEEIYTEAKKIGGVPCFFVPVAFVHQHRPPRSQIQFLLDEVQSVFLDVCYWRSEISSRNWKQVIALTRVQAKSVHLLCHFEGSDVVWFYLAVENRVQLRHHSPFYKVDGVDTPAVFGYDRCFIKAAACELIKIIARSNREVHFRRNNRRCRMKKHRECVKTCADWHWHRKIRSAMHDKLKYTSWMVQ